MLARQAWRLIEYPNSLCARVLKGKYFTNGELVDMTFPKQVSPTWRVIEHGLDLVKKSESYGILARGRKSTYGGTHDCCISRLSESV
jgi:hypothetical protein